MPLVFLPDVDALFLWGEDKPRALASFEHTGEAWTSKLVTPNGVLDTAGRKLPLLEALSQLAVIPAAELPALPGSVAAWAVASKLAIDLVSRERIIPTITRAHGQIEARWAAALSGSDDAARVNLIAKSMPAAAHAVPIGDLTTNAVWAPDALLRAYLDAVVDALVRAARGGPELPARASKHKAWSERWQSALAGPQRSFEAQGFGERNVVDELARWSEPLLGARDRLRACFRLELPQADGEAFSLCFLLQAPDDLSLLVPASEVWSSRGRNLEKLGRAFRDPQESLLEALARAARLYPPIARALEQARPEQIELDPAGAWSFLGEGAATLAEAGFGVIVPAELTAAGQRRLRLRMRVGGKAARVAGVVSAAAGLGMDELLTVDWEAVIGKETLSAQELAALAAQKAPLVRYRGAWVAIDPAELPEIQARLKRGPSRMSLREGVQAALLGETKLGELAVTASASGVLAELLERLKHAGGTGISAPATLQATLRPYQERGLHWLITMGALGLGACLADDMGLGKTMQLLAALLHRLERAPEDVRPALLIAPTSVVGNWEREIARFAPALSIVRHYGAQRARTPQDFPQKPGALVLTTYGLLRRDAELLAQVDWALAALDEAQNIKNSASATAHAARALRASQRFALTGTPVENRLAELWSILEFANPGLLGPIERFRRDFAVPIERYANEAAATRLRRIVSPFILRREKSDPNIIQDLPPKHEMKVVCTLTREQATLYKAVVDEELRRIEQADGMARRGRVLALLTYSKQICNHPAQFLGERGPLLQRSGKLARVSEMLEEAMAAGDKALVFTQFRDMGDKLTAHLTAQLGCEVLFLHGGTSKKARDEMVHRFQTEPNAARVFVLSVKAGGTGLNLTAANHVFHFDRWWNPAVEDQATDRAYRIGQTRSVQVHKLVCAGTVEEKIDRLLEHKRGLAQQVVSRGEQWITELGSSELRDLFTLADGAIAEEDGDAEAAAPPAKTAARKRKVSS
ncbi:MAG TPA: DEAD/DEAH box helicase [Polyangiales bacterium]|nr:DEAD/DEAH box helicase [Polyangiales bacterium]